MKEIEMHKVNSKLQRNKYDQKQQLSSMQCLIKPSDRSSLFENDIFFVLKRISVKLSHDI